jgi:hypothetical protein
MEQLYGAGHKIIQIAVKRNEARKGMKEEGTPDLSL